MIDPSERLTPVILCGGSGTRLWPRSRAGKPKPFLPLVSSDTLFQQALLRCANREQFNAPMIVSGGRHLELVESQIDPASDAEIIVEPQGKNTAAAIALAAFRLPANAIMLVCPSDHHIGDVEAFVDVIRSAAKLARAGWLVSFGIEAKSPETGFGYLRRGEAIGRGGFKVAEFVEKPDYDRARAYVESGNYAWNGGIFAFAAGNFLRELKKFRPGLSDAVERAVQGGSEDGRRFRPEPSAFSNVLSESVDYAIMENTDCAAMVLADMTWSDIGNWRAIHGAREQDAFGNTVRGPAELIDCRNVLVDSDGPSVHAIDVHDLIIVVDGNDIVVTSAEGAHRVSLLAGAVNQ